MNREQFEDQARLAGDYASKLARRNGYYWKKWGEAPAGKCTAAFDREGRTWSLTFTWHASEELEALKQRIEHMDHSMRAAMNEFGALKAGVAMREAGGIHSSLVGSA